LAPEGPPIDVEELERAIAEKMLQEEMARNPEAAVARQQHVQIPTESAPDNCDPEGPALSPQLQNGLEDEEDLSCPPDLEEVSQKCDVPDLEETCERVEEEEVAAIRAGVEAVPSAASFSDNVVQALTQAIKESMQNYQDMGDNYEPSADELIDVLKNLENLAAVNPALYRAIVDQIKVPVGQGQQAQHDQPNPEDHLQPEYEEVAVSNGMESHDMDTNEVMEQAETNGCDEADFRNGGDMAVESAEMMQEEVIQEQQMSAEEIRKAQIQQQVEREHQELMKAAKQRAKKEKTPPPPPKTITVMAGSKNTSSWPIYSGVPNAGVAKKVELTAGSTETEEELARNRIEVAQNAGLRHVEVINGDEAFYPQPMKDYDYPWAGSLKPVSKGGIPRGGSNRVNEPGAMPWAGSLRHVDQNKQKRRHQKNDDDDDMYGNAPWMGTLRHVTHENKVVQSYKSPQFKKYPDEDAPNPFQGSGGRDAKPAYPLTPAALLGSAPTLEETKNKMEDVDRIRTNLRETRTVSSSLLKVLMPKLLKEHESKYEPLGHDESFNIMEEILAMQIGLNADQKVEDNDEAEQIIRAITHGEIDQKVYSQMADDLESAVQQKRKESSAGGKKKVKKAAAGKKKKVTKKKDSGAGDASAPSASEVEPSASESNLIAA